LFVGLNFICFGNLKRVHFIWWCVLCQKGDETLNRLQFHCAFMKDV
jgi:hypothetical protein